MQDEIERVLDEFLDSSKGVGDFKLEPESDARRRFGVNVKTATPFELEALLAAAT